MKEWILLLLLTSLNATGISQKMAIQLNQNQIELEKLEDEKLKDLLAKQASGDYAYLVIRFEQKDTSYTSANMQAQGLTILRQLAPQTYIAKISQHLSATNLAELGIQNIGQINERHKIAANLRQQTASVNVLVKLHEAADEEISQNLAVFGKIVTHPYLSKEDVIYLQAHSNQLEQLAALPFVAYLQVATSPQLLVNENAAVHGVNYLQHHSGLQLKGEGVVVGIGDGGTINTHFDLNARHLNRTDIDDSQHASLVSGIIAGDGTMNYRKTGLATKSNIIAAYFGTIIDSTSAYFDRYDMSLANHSYANGWEGDFCDNAGIYDLFSEAIDQKAVDAPKVLHLIAAGNSGGASCSPYPSSYRTVLNGIQTAKNVLTVGASMDNDMIWSASSRGPVRDGRLKPEIVAVGVNVRGTSTTNGYTTGSGTSFAAPTVAGTAALLTQYYQAQHNNSLPDAALLKAILCNSADDLGNEGPDYIYGFGRLNGKKAAKIIEHGNYFSDSLVQAAEKNFTIQVPASAKRLKVMLAWTDPAASPLSTQQLVNNLDVVVEAPDASVHYPWLLDTTANLVANPAFRASSSQRDSINNIEQITIETPTSGTYTIKVQGTNIPMDAQPFHVVYEILEQSLDLTHPLGGEIAIPNANLLITWDDTIGFAGDSLQLFYTLNAGSTWTPIEAPFAADRTQYNFTMPDTSSNQVQIRITNLSGTFADTSGVFTSMRRPPLTATPNCDGTVSLTWSAVTDANSYELYQYTNDDWTLIHTTSDLGYIVTGLAVGQEHCFSAKAITANGVESGFAVGRCVVTFGSSINTYPYQEDFEEDAGNWFSLGKNNEWEWGVPNNTLIREAADGDKAWVTDLDGNYSDASLAYLYSPCFDLSNLSSPVFSFALWLDVEEDTSNVYDYVQVQYSEDGLNWTTLGVNGGGYHWYNNLSGANVWDGTTSHWQQARYDVTSTGSSVRFRILLNSDSFTHQEGVGVDNIYIYDAAAEDHFVLLQAKIALEGIYDSTSMLMQDSFRQQQQLPLQSPYEHPFAPAEGEIISDPNILDTTGNDAIVDWVLLELRDKTNRSALISARAALLQSDGDIVDTDGASPISLRDVAADDFYIVVKHRNHLGIMTAQIVELANILLRQ
ncbi:MAG: S8 family serine peptidase [Bacteroidota bacterium]